MSGVLVLANNRSALPLGCLIHGKTPIGLDNRSAFVSWLFLFLQVARGVRHSVQIDRATFPDLIAQRRMVHRLALAYAVALPRTRWPLGGGLAVAPAQRLPDSLQPLGLGAQRPAVVLVGDRPQPGAPRWAAELGWPFISGLGTGCSSWLAEQLELGGIPEELLLWINARLSSGEPDDGRLSVLYKQQQETGVPVIALGKHAAKALEHYSIVHEEVHHPQHWKRFHHREPYYLPRLIRKYLRKRRAA